METGSEHPSSSLDVLSRNDIADVENGVQVYVFSCIMYRRENRSVNERGIDRLNKASNKSGDIPRAILRIRSGDIVFNE